jgi:probable rRNA maturation factor
MTPPTDDEPRSSSPRSEADDDPYPATTGSSTHTQLELFDPTNLLPSSEHERLHKWTAAVFAHLNATGSIRVKLVNDEQMSAAHLQYSGIPGTTDVLTFDLNPDHDLETDTPKELDTDLIICVDEASRQSSDRDHSTTHEILLYIIHGTLHCLGYNDHTHEDFNTMHTYEDQLLTQAGIGPLFDQTNSSPAKESNQ